MFLLFLLFRHGVFVGLCPSCPAGKSGRGQCLPGGRELQNLGRTIILTHPGIISSRSSSETLLEFFWNSTQWSGGEFQKSFRRAQDRPVGQALFSAPFSNALWSLGLLLAGDASTNLHPVGVHWVRCKVIFKRCACRRIYIALSIRFMDNPPASLQGDGLHVTVAYINCMHNSFDPRLADRLRQLCEDEVHDSVSPFFGTPPNLMRARFTRPHWQSGKVILYLHDCQLAECIGRMQELIFVTLRRRGVTCTHAELILVQSHMQLHPKRDELADWFFARSFFRQEGNPFHEVGRRVIFFVWKRYTAVSRRPPPPARAPPAAASAAPAAPAVPAAPPAVAGAVVGSLLAGLSRGYGASHPLSGLD